MKRSFKLLALLAIAFCHSYNVYAYDFMQKYISDIQSAMKWNFINSSMSIDDDDDKWSCSEGQKIYEGDFELFGQKGKAKYQYYEGQNRTRIFDGHFVFKGNCYVQGDFKENHQKGEWVFVNSPIGDVKINFDDTSFSISGSFYHKYDVCGDNVYCEAIGKFVKDFN